MASWRDGASGETQADLDGLLNSVLPFAHQQLGTRRAFFPFGAVVADARRAWPHHAPLRRARAAGPRRWPPRVERTGLADIGNDRIAIYNITSLARIWLSPSGLSKLLDRMELSGLITREPDPSDARSWLAVVTASGRTRVRRARLSHHALLSSTFGSVLHDRELTAVTSAISKLAESVALDATVTATRAERVRRGRR